MPDSYHDITYTNQSSVSFTNTDLKYLETAHLQLIATNTGSGDSTTFLQTGSPAFTVSVNAGTTTLDLSAITGSFPAGTNRVRVSRVTPSDNLLTNFVNSSLLRAEDLNQNSEQLLFVLQEQLDKGTGSLPLTASDEYDAGTRKIINVVDATSDKEVTNLGQVAAFVAGIGNTPSVPQVYTFNLGATTPGTVANGNTTFTLDPTPTSEIDGTFICEVGGVIQRPTADFTVNGNVLTVVGQALNATDFNGSTLILQNFGVSRNVFSFPVTGEAASSSETPITLKGFSGGDATSLLDVKDSANASNATISAGGTVKAKVIEPLQSGTLSVNPTTVTTSGTISSGGNLSVGSDFTVTQSTGDVAANKIVLAQTSGFADNNVVPKSYVDTSGGLGGNLPNNTNLNTLLTPQRASLTVPASPTTYNFPAQVVEGDTAMIIVHRCGGTGSTVVNQELQVFRALTQQTFSFYRLYNGSEFSDWFFELTDRHRITDMTAPNANFNMNFNEIVGLSAPTAGSHAATKAYVDGLVPTDTQSNSYQPFHRRFRAAFKATATLANTFSSFSALSFDEADGIDTANSSVVKTSGTGTAIDLRLEIAFNPNFSNVNYMHILDFRRVHSSVTAFGTAMSRSTDSTNALFKGTTTINVPNQSPSPDAVFTFEFRGAFFSIDQQN